MREEYGNQTAKMSEPVKKASEIESAFHALASEISDLEKGWAVIADQCEAGGILMNVPETLGKGLSGGEAPSRGSALGQQLEEYRSRVSRVSDAMRYFYRRLAL